MGYRTMIVVKTEFEGLHNWETCNIDRVTFLKHPHRHKFYVTVKLEVSHDDRDLEFFIIKNQLDAVIEGMFEKYPGFFNVLDLGSMSCEMMAKRIIAALLCMHPANKVFCSVFEDNENGAEVHFTVD